MKKIILSIAISILAIVSKGQFSTAGCTTSGTGITVGSSCVTAAFNSNGSVDYWNGATGCSAVDNDDSWWWFTATSTSTTITYNSTNDAILTLFSAACSPTMSSIACADNTSSGNETIVYATTIGTTYKVRIQRYNANTDMTGTICVYNNVPPSCTTNSSPANAATG